jgi:hypothetical protein
LKILTIETPARIRRIGPSGRIQDSFVYVFPTRFRPSNKMSQAEHDRRHCVSPSASRASIAFSRAVCVVGMETEEVLYRERPMMMQRPW